MPFTIRAALDNLVTLQAALTIASPVTEQIARSYKTFPNQGGKPEAPCFINVPQMDRVSHFAGAREQRWRVRSQILVENPDRDVAADIVLAYLQKYLDALSDAITLNGIPAHIQEISSGELGGFEYGGFAFTGIEVTVPIVVPFESVTVGP